MIHSGKSPLVFVYSRGKKPTAPQQEDISVPHYLTRLNTTLSAMIEIENRKESIDVSTFWSSLGWEETRRGHQVELHMKQYLRDVYVVFTPKNYPFNEAETPEEDD